MMTNVRWAVILAAVHLVLALLYAKATPFMTPGILKYQRTAEGPAKVIDVGAPDELQHVAYVRRIAAGEGFPVLDPKDPDLGRTYQSHQPPFFYLLAGGWSKLAGDSQMGLRSLNAMIGAATVVGVFFLGLWGTGRLPIAVGASAFAALLPMNVALSGAVSNDPLLFCLATWSLALATKYLVDGMCVKRAILLGVVVGLACLTKTTAIALFPALLVGLALTKERPPVARIGLCVIVALAVAAPWWLRNQQLYGDPLAMGVFSTAFQGSPKAQDFIQAVGAPTYWLDYVGWWTLRSFIGVFGYMDIFLPEKLYRLGFALLFLLGVLGLASLRNPESVDKGRAPIHWMNFAFFAVVAGLFVMFNRTYFQGQARYLLPAIGPLSLAIAMGAAGFSKAKPIVPVSVVAMALLCLNGYILSRLPDEFRLRSDQTSLAEQASN